MNRIQEASDELAWTEQAIRELQQQAYRLRMEIGALMMQGVEDEDA